MGDDLTFIDGGVKQSEKEELTSVLKPIKNAGLTRLESYTQSGRKKSTG